MVALDHVIASGLAVIDPPPVFEPVEHFVFGRRVFDALAAYERRFGPWMPAASDAWPKLMNRRDL